MGWCSGTDVFDKMVGHIVNNPTIPNKTRRYLITALISTLESHDWDCQSDSAFYNNETVREAFQRLHPDWLVEEDELGVDDLSK